MQDLVPFVIATGIAVALAVTVIAVQFIPAKFWFGGIALFALPQIYLVPIAGVYPSLSLLASIGPLYSWRQAGEIWQVLWFRAFVFLICAHLISIAWSSSPLAGVRHIIYLLPFAVALFVGFVAARLHPVWVRKIVVVAVGLSVFQALLVIVFRILPSLESMFWGSRFAAVVISPNVLGALYDGSPNNVFDVTKSGGLFVNANTASAVLGFFSMLAWSLGSGRYGKLLKGVAVFNWIAVFFTGSKAGMIAAVLVPAVAVVLHRKDLKKVGLLGLAAMFIGAGLTVPIIPFAIERLLDSTLVSATASTFDIRQVIWAFAKQEFIASPILGLGFGGWEERFPLYAIAHRINPNFPAHNAFMIAWSQSGLIAVACLLAFLVLFLKWALDASRSQNQRIRELGSGLFLGCTWFWIQAQGENFGILGEQHFTPLLGLVSGMLFAHIVAQKRVEIGLSQGGSR